MLRGEVDRFHQHGTQIMQQHACAILAMLMRHAIRQDAAEKPKNARRMGRGRKYSTKFLGSRSSSSSARRISRSCACADGAGGFVGVSVQGGRGVTPRWGHCAPVINHQAHIKTCWCSCRLVTSGTRQEKRSRSALKGAPSGIEYARCWCRQPVQRAVLKQPHCSCLGHSWRENKRVYGV